MVIGAHTVFSCATNFLNGRKCVFCGSFKTVKTARSYVKCMLCGKQKSLSKLRREIAILQGFYQQQLAHRLASDLGLDAKTILGCASDCGWFCSIRQNWKALSSRARLRWMSLTLGVLVRGNAAEVREARASFLAFWSGMAGSALDTSAR